MVAYGTVTFAAIGEKLLRKGQSNASQVTSAAIGEKALREGQSNASQVLLEIQAEQDWLAPEHIHGNDI